METVGFVEARALVKLHISLGDLMNHEFPLVNIRTEALHLNSLGTEVSQKDVAKFRKLWASNKLLYIVSSVEVSFTLKPI